MSNQPIVNHRTPKQLLTPASGFLQGYSHTLNPYVGCTFGCSYCYVRRMPVGLFRKETWGEWVDIKQGASDVLRKDLEKARRKGPVTIFMSSSTDPYQPIEANAEVTRSLLEVMVEHPPDFLFIQTRSSLVTRDIDLFKQLHDRLLISMTIETDREDIRKAFTPTAPPVQGRLSALSKLKEAKLPLQAAISPVLPSTDDFPKLLVDVVDRVVIDDYFMGDGQQGKRTKQLGIAQLYQQLGLESWYTPTAYLRVVRQFKKYFQEQQIRISQQGFLPPAP